MQLPRASIERFERSQLAFFLDKPQGTWTKIGIAIVGLVLGWLCYSIASNILTYMHTTPKRAIRTADAYRWFSWATSRSPEQIVPSCCRELAASERTFLADLS